MYLFTFESKMKFIEYGCRCCNRNCVSFFSYGKFLLKNGKFKEAVERLKNSRDVFIAVRGRYESDYVNILNDLAVASLHV